MRIKTLKVVLCVLIGLTTLNSMSATIAYRKEDKLYVYDPDFLPRARKIEDRVRDYQVGHHIIAFKEKDELMVASPASSWRPVKVDDRVTTYHLSHETLVYEAQKELFVVESYTPTGVVRKKLANNPRGFAVYDAP